MRPSDHARREVRDMLRAGLSRVACERYLAGRRLMAVLSAHAWIPAPTTFYGYLREYYGPMVWGVLNRKSPLVDMLRGTWRRTYGKWRVL